MYLKLGCGGEIQHHYFAATHSIEVGLIANVAIFIQGPDGAMPGCTAAYFCLRHELLAFYPDESGVIALNPVAVKRHVNGNVCGPDSWVVFDFFQKLL